MSRLASARLISITRCPWCRELTRRLLGKEYAKDVSAGSDHHLHIRAAGRREELWRISLESVDGWALGAAGAVDQDGKGPFARLLSA